MREEVLHYAWGAGNFDLRGLRLETGESVYIFEPGKLNFNQGPDFLGARIMIAGVELHGAVELHVKGKDWWGHGHDRDAVYNGVILHVVLEISGKKVMRKDGTFVPELSLQGRLPVDLLKRSEEALEWHAAMPCSGVLQRVEETVRQDWMNALGMRRLERKAEGMRKRLGVLVQHWEQVLWEEISASFGGSVNQEGFRDLATALPWKVVQKYAVTGNFLALEALFFGAGEMLSGRGEADEWQARLKKEWEYLRMKHRLKAKPVLLHFHRMRPPSFPTVRLGQLARFVSTFPVLVDLLLPGAVRRLMKSRVDAGTYWEKHSRFGVARKGGQTCLGKQFLEVLCLNTLGPLALLYRQAHGEMGEVAGEVVREYFRPMQAEDNRILRHFASLGLKAADGLQSQGLIEMRKRYCDRRLCMHCAIGQGILQSGC